MNPHDNSDTNNSLRAEIARRRLASVKYETLERRVNSTKGSAPTGAINQVNKPIQTQATATTPYPGVDTSTPDKKRVYRQLTGRQRATLGLVGVVMLIVMVLSGSLLTGTTKASSDSAITPTYPSLPLSNVDSVLQRLRAVGVLISNLKPYDTSKSDVWHNVTTAYEFTVQRGNDKGDFTLFGYPTTAQAQNDVFELLADDRYKNWGVYTFGNITLISTPDTVEGIKSEIVSHLTQFLFAPYRPFWATSTPAPTAVPLTATSQLK